MKKSFLLGLGAAAASAFVISKKLTESQKDRIAMKIEIVVVLSLLKK